MRVTKAITFDGLPLNPVASYLRDIGDELSPRQFRAYIAEIRDLVPADEFDLLEQACRHVEQARATVQQVARRLR